MAAETPITDLVTELQRRSREGFKHAPFKMAFWIGVLLCGGLGVWFELYRLVKHLILTSGAMDAEGLLPLRTAVATFFPAIIGATSLQMALEERVKSVRGVAVCAPIVLFLLLTVISDRDLPNGFGLVLGVIASSISVWIWCAANGLSATYRDSIDAPVGDKELDDHMPGEDDLAGLSH